MSTQPSDALLAAVNLGDLERLAGERLEPSAFDYIRGGADVVIIDTKEPGWL